MPYTIGIDVRKIQDFGIGTYISQLIQGLAEIDTENQYVLIAAPQGRDAIPDLPDNFRVAIERSPVYSLRELATLSWKLFRLKLDLYHSTHYVLPAALPCPAVATIHDIIHLLYPDFLPSRLALLYAQRMIRSTLARGERIIAVSQNTKEDLQSYFGVDGRKIEVVYNGVDDLFRAEPPAAVDAEWVEKLGLDEPYLLFVGNPKPHKNLDNVVKAFARAQALKPFDAKLVCVGARQTAEFKIRQRAEQIGISDRLQLVGHVPQEALPVLYRHASLFLYPTLYEGFGLPVVEAMASGAPVITSNTSALKEIAQGYAHLVDPLNVEKMALAISHCMADPDYRAQLAEKGLRRAEDFQWRFAAAQTLSIYLRALGAAGKSSASDAPEAA